MIIPNLSKKKANHVIFGAIMSSFGCMMALITFMFFISEKHLAEQLLISGVFGILFALFMGAVKTWKDIKEDEIRLDLGFRVLNNPKVMCAIFSMFGGLLPAIPILVLSIPYVARHLKFFGLDIL